MISALTDEPTLPAFDPTQPLLTGDEIIQQVRHVTQCAVHFTGFPRQWLDRIATSIDDTKGTLTVCSDAIYFWCSTERVGFKLEFADTIIHAIMRAPSPSVYLQISSRELMTADGALERDGNNNNNNDDGEDSDVLEIRLEPTDSVDVDMLYQAFSECAELHPPPVCDSDEDNNNSSSYMAMQDQYGDDEDEGEDDEDLFSEQGMAVLNRLGPMLARSAAAGVDTSDAGVAAGLAQAKKDSTSQEEEEPIM